MNYRVNHGPQKKQNKWNDPFYANSRCQKGDYYKLWSKWKRMPFPKKSTFKKA